MKLLLVVVAVCAVWPHSVLTKPSKQVRDIHPYPYEISGPKGSKAQPIQYNLYSYRINNNPFESNLRQYGQNPDIPESVNRIDGPAVIRADIPGDDGPSAFNKGSVQAFPWSAPQVFTYDAADKYVDGDQFDDGDIPLRSAVESIPIEAEVYSHLRNPDFYSDNLQFNREGVESLPAFPTPYTRGFNDKTNARPYGQVSEQYSAGHIPIVDKEIDFVQPYRSSASARSTGKLKREGAGHGVKRVISA